MRVVPQAALASVAIGLALVLTTLSCGRASAPAPQLQPGVAAPSREAAKPTLAAILAQIDAYPVPKGLSADRWAALTSALKQKMAALGASGKTFSSAPTGTNNSVTDLVADPTGGTQATLTWTEKLWGDYSNDGSVDIADLAPMALYYGEHTDSGPNDGHRVVDAGDGNPEIDIDDLIPMANDYSAHLQGYQVWRGHWNGTSVDWETTPRPNPNAANPNWSADRPSPPVDARPPYTYNDDISSVADKANVRYKVTPYGDGAPGVDSVVAIMPPPVVSRLQGTILYNSTGLAGVTVTLTPGGQNATTDVSGAYEIIDVADGSYTLTPSLTDYTFVPPDRSVTVAGVNQTGLDFTAQTVHSYSGTVTLGMSGLAGVTVTLTPGGTTATTQPDGTYTITTAVVIGQALTLTPTKAGYSFTPLARNFNATNSDLTGQDFAATQLSLGNTPWPKFHGNAANRSWSNQAAAQSATVKWTHAFNGPVESSPVIGADGTVYVATTTAGNSLYALNPADGSVKWAGGPAAASTASTPAIASNGTIFYGTNDGNVYALGADGSTNQWPVRSIGSPPVGSPTIGTDGTIYIGNNGAFYALNPADGSNVWSTMLGNMQSCPAIGSNGTIYAAGGSSNVKALNPADGSPFWSSPVGMSTNSSPSLSPDGQTVYIGGNNGALYAINTTDGSQRWLFPFGAPGNAVASSPAVDPNGNIYVGNSGGVTGIPGVVAISPAGVQIWQFTTNPAFVESSPAIGFATLYVGCDDGKVYALNTLDGSVIWSYTTGGAVKSSPAIAADGTVYVGSDDNKVYAFGP